LAAGEDDRGCYFHTSGLKNYMIEVNRIKGTDSKVYPIKRRFARGLALRSLHLKADSAGDSGYHGGMSPSDSSTNVTPEQLAGYVGGTSSPSDSDLCDWSKGHTIIDWPFVLFNDALIIAGVGLVVWIILRIRK
jgi:hypothetical protein